MTLSCTRLCYFKTRQTVAVYKKKTLLILKVKKRWEDIATSVKKKERTARHNEINRLKITGNGNLPDEQVNYEC